MLVASFGGSDKCTSSNATGHQEYHPVYGGPGNITNAAWRGHGNGILPVAFLPIPKGIISTFIASRTSQLFSQQVSKEKTGIPAVYMATLPCLPGACLGTIKAIHDKAQGCSMS
jgi:Plavaka transposase